MTPIIPTPLLPGFPLTTHLPRHSLNILCGPSHSGKSKLVQSAIRDYLATGQWLGSAAPEFPESGGPQVARVGYLAAQLLDLPPQVAQIAWQNAQWSRQDDLPPTIEWLYEQFASPRPQLLIIENFQLLMPGGRLNDNCEVSRWCTQLARWRESHDVTMVCTAPQAKMKADESYAPYDRVLGAVAWMLECATAWVYEVTYDDADVVCRRLVTLTRGKPEPPRFYDFDSDGWLVSVAQIQDWRAALATKLATTPAGEPLTTAQIIEWGKSLGVARPTIEKWLTESIERGVLERVKMGTYRRPFQN